MEGVTSSEYLVMAAQHSRHNAGHWFRYLRKFIDKYGTSITQEQIEELYNNEALSPFQRVSVKVAFEEGSQTQQHIISLNKKVVPKKLALVRAKYEH